MADKNKYHPGGTVPPRRRSLNKNTQLLKAKSLAMENQIAKELGYSSKAELSTALRNASPQEQRSLNSRLTTVGNRLQKQFNIDNKQLISDNRRTDMARRRAKLSRARRSMPTTSNRSSRNPLMPTAGFDARQRNIRGTTPMPGPAPDSARMRRMQKLMREQQRRFNTRRGSLGNARFEPRVTAEQFQNVRERLAKGKNIKDVYEGFTRNRFKEAGRGPTGTGTPLPKNPLKLKNTKTRTDGGMPRPTRRKR